MCPGQEFLYSGFQTSGHARVHAGNVYNQYAPFLAPEKPRPRMLLPFGRDKNFVGREEILVSLATMLTDDDYHNRVALTGPGGIGKSQIAIEFAYQWQKRHQDRWIFWVPANNRARFIDAYREIARVVKIDSGSHNILDSVHTWLSDEDNGRWLMIVDNADSRDVLFGRKPGESKTIQSRIPQVAHGCVLITSRNQTGISLSGDHQNAIIVAAPPKAEAIDLLQRRIAHRPSKEHLSKLAEKLDCIPLALTQAAAYISRTRLSVERYLSNLSRNERSEVYYLAQEWDDLRRANVHNAVLATVWVTIRRIRKASPYAAMQLCVMTMFHRQAIPVRPNPRKDEAMGLLLEWAVMTKDIEEHTYTMHRIVQVCVKAWIRFCLPAGKKKLEQFRALAVDELASMIREIDSKDPTQTNDPHRARRQQIHRWPDLLPHLRILARAKVLHSRKCDQLAFLSIISTWTHNMYDLDSAFEFAQELLVRLRLLYPRMSLSRYQKGFYHLIQAVHTCDLGLICVERGLITAAETLLRDTKTAAKQSRKYSRQPNPNMKKNIEHLERRVTMAKENRSCARDYERVAVSMPYSFREHRELLDRVIQEIAILGEHEKLEAYAGICDGADEIVTAVEEELKLEDPFRILALQRFSDSLEAIGVVSKAEELHQKAINGFETTSSQRCQSMKRYAEFLRRQGREEEAVTVEQEIEELRDSAR